MANNTVLNVCRLCGSSSGVMISILDPKHEKYQTKIASLLHINISASDPLPKSLCHRCVIKIDDFQAFVDSSHATQGVLSKNFLHKELNVIDLRENYPTLPCNKVNGLNSNLSLNFEQVVDSAPPINPVEVIQLNLLTCSNSNEESFGRSRFESSPNFPPPRFELEPQKIVSELDKTPVPRAKPVGPRRGSRPFPKKPGQVVSSQNLNTESLSHGSGSDAERVPSSTENTPADIEERGQESEESSTTDDKSSKTSKPSNLSSPPKKKKKYLSPFEVPSRRRRIRKKPEKGKKVDKKSNKSQSSSDEDAVESTNKSTSIPEEDLEKYFILTKIPSVGMIYTCRKCEAIFTSAKATSSHTKCMNKRHPSEEEQDENSSSSESSDVERSDASKSDQTEKESIYQCSYCDKPFTRNVVCLQHEQTHIRELNVTDEEEDVFAPRKSKKKIPNKSLAEKFIMR